MKRPVRCIKKLRRKTPEFFWYERLAEKQLFEDVEIGVRGILINFIRVIFQ
jgi:hypothetical protein